MRTSVWYVVCQWVSWNNMNAPVSKFQTLSPCGVLTEEPKSSNPASATERYQKLNLLILALVLEAAFDRDIKVSASKYVLFPTWSLCKGARSESRVQTRVHLSLEVAGRRKSLDLVYLTFQLGPPNLTDGNVRSLGRDWRWEMERLVGRRRSGGGKGKKWNLI